MNNHHTKLKGDIALSFVCYDLTKRGYFVSTPVSENSPYDLICDSPQGLYKVQVKYRASLDIPSKGSWADKNGNHSKSINDSDFDYFAMVYGDFDKVCYPPVSLKGCSLFENHAKCMRHLVKNYSDIGTVESPMERVLTNGAIVKQGGFSKEVIIKAINENCTIKEAYESLGLTRAYFSSLMKEYGV